MQSQHKPRFSHWLIEQVGTGQYAGLCYVEQNTFRVPWKHNSRKDCNEDTIFREWAVVTGKIHEFPNDKAKWKTNFRCALNNLCKPPLKCFKRIQDNSRTMPDDPHKVYEIINTGYNYGSEPMEGCLDDPDIYSSPIDYFPPGNEHTLVNYMRTLELNNDHTGQQQCGEEICVEQSPAVPVSYAVVQPSPVEPQPVSQNHTQQIPQQASYYSANPEPVQTLSPYDLEISIHYRRKEVLKTQVSCSRLQLHCHHEAPEPNNICFPTTECLLDHKQIRYTNQILNSIQRGLLLEVRDTGIYACRQSDKCRVFASTSDPSEALSESSQLPQNTMMQLLSFDNFVSEWKQFKNNQGGSPHYTINICFGEKFPDGKPMEKKLIMVKVVPLLCRQWHEMAQSDGASSLQSACISLQISHNSHNSLYDLISNAFSLPSFDDDAATPY